MKSWLTTMLPLSRWVAMPVSTTATPMPRPVKPAMPSEPAHTWSAPIASVVTDIRMTGASPESWSTSASWLSASS